MSSHVPPLPKSPPRATELICDDGEPMESARNMFLYFSETQARRNDFRGPDVFVVLGTERRERAPALAERVRELERRGAGAEKAD